MNAAQRSRSTKRCPVGRKGEEQGAATPTTGERMRKTECNEAADKKSQREGAEYGERQQVEGRGRVETKRAETATVQQAAARAAHRGAPTGRRDRGRFVTAVRTDRGRRAERRAHSASRGAKSQRMRGRERRRYPRDEQISRAAGSRTAACRAPASRDASADATESQSESCRENHARRHATSTRERTRAHRREAAIAAEGEETVPLRSGETRKRERDETARCKGRSDEKKRRRCPEKQVRRSEQRGRSTEERKLARRRPPSQRRGSARAGGLSQREQGAERRPRKEGAARRMKMSRRRKKRRARSNHGHELGRETEQERDTSRPHSETRKESSGKGRGRAATRAIGNRVEREVRGERRPDERKRPGQVNESKWGSKRKRQSGDTGKEQRERRERERVARRGATPRPAPSAPR
ncbi:hypothetical protein Tco_0749166 [Tanacetum coccineum]|uniref:Uncharacterized protein n=1 Tax=Tanacetum coccineum TaxID=301880 RepID=A0ABQ4YYM4_9ASTR